MVGEDEALPGESTREQSRTNTIPKVSVVIPCYNGSAYLEECLQSIAALADPDWEVLVVDDGSTENIREVVERFAPLARYLWQANAGPSAARNNGFRATSGQYVRFLDSDDYFLSVRGLREQVTLLDAHPEVGLVYAQATKVDTHRRPLGVRKSPWARQSYIHTGDTELTRLLFYNYITTSSTLVRRTVFEQAGPFRTEISSGEDWDCWLRIAHISSVGYVAEPVVAYRVHEKSLTARYSSMPWLPTHLNTLDTLFADPEFALRHSRLREPIYAYLDVIAASEAYRTRNMKLSRLYALKALRRTMRSRRWGDSMQSFWILSKSLIPSGVRERLKSLRKQQRLVTMRTLLLLRRG